MKLTISRTSGISTQTTSGWFDVDYLIKVLNGHPDNLQVSAMEGDRYICVTQVGEYDYIRVAQGIIPSV